MSQKLYCMYYLMPSRRPCFAFMDNRLTLPFHSDLNRLVMDYLVIEGYKTAAEEFSREAGLNSPVDFESIESRMNIREALQRGDVSEAITRVNDLNPEVSRFVSHIVRPPSGGGGERIQPFMHHA